MAKRLNVKRIALVLALILILIVILNFNNWFGQKKNSGMANLQLTILTNPECDCFDITSDINKVKQNATIISEETLNFSSEKGKIFIEKYNITKIPAIILSGEIDKYNSEDFEKKDDVLVFTKTEAPYTEPSGKIKGFVNVTYLKPDCASCTDLKPLIAQLKFVLRTNDQIVNASSDEGQNIIKKYNITIAPTLIFDSEIEAYPQIIKDFNEIGTHENDGSYIMRKIRFPYMNLETGKVEGLVTMTMLTDSSCGDCYNVSLHKLILAKIGVVIANEKSFDISSSEGKELIKKYNITAVPTIILSKDASAYESLTKIWSEVGSVESDAYVFRNMTSIGNYKDLLDNKIVIVVRG